MINVLVTGANGQLALTIKELFYKNGDQINFIFKNKAELDISNHDKVKDFFKSNQLDYCVNCAAFTNVELAETKVEEAFEINAEAVRNLSIACQNTNVVLLHISTDYVFDGKSSKPYKETNQPNPLNVYGKSKLEGEIAVISTLSNYFIVRSSWLYSKYGHNFFKTVIKKIQNGETMNVVNTQIGTPTNCDDLANFIYFLIKTKNDQFGIYHFAPIGQTSWYGFALYIASYFKSNHIKPVETYRSLAKKPKNSILSNEKIKSLGYDLGKWEDGVKRCLINYTL